MKTIKTISIILILSAAVILVASTSGKTTTAEVVVFGDITDQQIVHPVAADILHLYDFAQNKWNGGVFHFSHITEVSFNPVEEIKIEAQNQWTHNEFQRDSEIKGFQKSISDIIASAEQTPVGKNNSSVYLPVASQLNRLAQSKSDKRILLIYSDLMENTADMSFYSKKILSEIQNNPQAIRKSFEQLQPLPNLNGIEVYFIYQPQNTDSDKAFTIVSAFYKKLLEDKGARVTISANINP